MLQPNPAPSNRSGNLPKIIPNQLLIGLVVITAIGLIIGGALFFNNQAQAIHEQKADELKSIASLKVQQIVQWRQERLTDARMNSTSPFFDQAIDQWLTNPNDVTLKTALINRLQMIVDLEAYQNVILASADGKLLLSLDPGTASLDAETQKLAAQAFSSHEIIMGDLVRNAVSGKVTLNIAAPIPDGQKLPAAVLVLQVDPEKYLYPLIQSWPVPSLSAETLLIQKESADVLYLNTLRFRPDPPLTIRIPLTQTEIPSVQAGLGHTGIVEGPDYRGINVLAEILPVPGTLWFMVAKVDKSEILSEVSSLGLAVLLVVTLAMLMVALLAIYVFNTHQRKLYKTLYQLERDKSEAQEETRTTLYSIGDGVITTDAQGMVTRLNPVAENLTGWREAEAFGKPLADVFHIINETTRLKIENPVERVLGEGRIVGLANHTLLIHKDGSERPIADSSAPIKDTEGHITGVVLVFRDQTEERAAQRERALLYYTMTHNLNEIYLFEADSYRFRFVNEGAQKNLGYSQEQLRTMTPLDIKPDFTLETFQTLVAPLVECRIPTLVFETVHQRANSSRYPVEVHLQLFEYEGDRVFLAVINDITERKQTEKSLQESEARLVEAQAVAHVGNWELNLADKTLWASAEAFNIYGLERTSPYLPLERAKQIPIVGERSRMDAALHALITQQTQYNEEFYIQRANDSAQRVIQSIAHLVCDGNGNPIKVIGVIQDVTERKQAEQATRESEKRYRALFQNNHAVMMLIDPEFGAIVDANPAAAEFYGWSIEELTQMNINQINILSGDFIQHEMQLARSEQQKSFQFQHRKKNGEVFDVEVFSGPIQLGGKTVLYSIVHDITDRKQAEVKVAEQLDELRAWHTATLGREMRILELKAEVDESLVQAGLLPRYTAKDEGLTHE